MKLLLDYYTPEMIAESAMKINSDVSIAMDRLKENPIYHTIREYPNRMSIKNEKPTNFGNEIIKNQSNLPGRYWAMRRDR